MAARGYALKSSYENKHFLEINHWSADELMALIQRALFFKKNPDYPTHPNEAVALLFYENSTRTRVSFELAAKKLGMSVINLDLKASSETKGELIKDTVQTLAAMGIKHIVMRHTQERLVHELAEDCGDKLHMVNAGDGMNSHPSQAMLDFMTIIENKPNLSQLKIAIIGDIRHSRVANSLQAICSQFGVADLTLIAPKAWQPTTHSYGRVTDSLRDGITDADVVICLRVQKERLLAEEQLDLASYHRDYALTQESLSYAKKDAMVMHPGPVNRGIEIDADVADGPQSFILKQVGNGVFMRMAILEYFLKRDL